MVIGVLLISELYGPEHTVRAFERTMLKDAVLEREPDEGASPFLSWAFRPVGRFFAAGKWCGVALVASREAR